MWSPADASDIFENDLLVQLDTLLFVVEVKAGGVADTARRGADKTLKRVIDDLVVAPARQSQRFAEFLTANQRRHEFKTRRGNLNVIDTSNTRVVIRLSVILEPPGDSHTRWNGLREAGLIDDDTLGCPTYLLTDLETIFEDLDPVSQRLHYLARREDIERHVNYAADEIDLLGLYIDTGLCCPRTCTPEHRCGFTGFRKSLMDITGAFGMAMWRQRNLLGSSPNGGGISSLLLSNGA